MSEKSEKNEKVYIYLSAHQDYLLQPSCLSLSAL